MMVGIKLYWSSIDALIAAIIATAGIGLIHHVHPGLHPLAYAAGWLVLASVLYQIDGCLVGRTPGSPMMM